MLLRRIGPLLPLKCLQRGHFAMRYEAFCQLAVEACSDVPTALATRFLLQGVLPLQECTSQLVWSGVGEVRQRQDRSDFGPWRDTLNLALLGDTGE